MEITRLSREEVGRRGEALYEQKIRAIVETTENIGKMVIIDVETGAYEIDTAHGLVVARHIQSQRPDAILYGKRIGYDVAEALEESHGEGWCMIIGHVSALHVLISVPFLRTGQSAIAIEFVVDTGFTGELCLPPDAVKMLGLPFRYDLRARLADDSAVMLPVYDATILWNGLEREVSVLATGKRPLIGTALLEGFEMLAQFREDGIVTIDAL